LRFYAAVLAFLADMPLAHEFRPPNVFSLLAFLADMPLPHESRSLQLDPFSCFPVEFNIAAASFLSSFFLQGATWPKLDLQIGPYLLFCLVILAEKTLSTPPEWVIHQFFLSEHHAVRFTVLNPF
jgi:hypothetical protein